MKSKFSIARWAATAAGIALGLMIRSGASAAPGDPECTCWYDGYEDGLEFPLAEITQAEHYSYCAKLGFQSPYEEGFTAAKGRKQRKCPL
jgi:hypothetical protein